MEFFLFNVLFFIDTIIRSLESEWFTKLQFQ